MQDELLLSECFSEGVRQARKASPADASQSLRVVNFDWHETTKRLKEKGCVEALWALLKPLLPAVGFSMGTLEPAGFLLPSAQGPFSGRSPDMAQFETAAAAEAHAETHAESQSHPGPHPQPDMEGGSEAQADPHSTAAGPQGAQDSVHEAAAAARHPLGESASDAEDEVPGQAVEMRQEEAAAAASSSASDRCDY